MLPYVFLLTVLFAAGGMANQAAGKWQLLFFYQVYRYQADALGLANTEMAVDCSNNGAVCDMKSFIKKVCKSKKVAIRDSKGKPIFPVQLVMDPDFDSEATVRENSLAGKKADEVRNWVATQNAAGHSTSHVEAISTASDMQKKFAAACGKK